MRTVIMIGILLGTRTVVAAPTLDDPPAPPSESARIAEPPDERPSHDRCDSGGYLEPTLLFGQTRPGSLGLLNRIAAGILFRDCDAQRTATTHARVGATAYLSNIAGGGGVGLEAEVDRPIADQWRLGLRIGAESATSDHHLFTLGARLHVSDAFFLQLDVARVTQTHGASTTTAMGGFGFQGKGGAALGGVELGVAGFLFLLLISTLSNAG